MNKKCTRNLTALTTLVAALYLPQAKAATFDYKTISLPISSKDSFFNDYVSSGAFTDIYDFSVATAAQISGHLESNFQYKIGAGSVNNFSLGVRLTGASLTDLTTGQTTLLDLKETGPFVNLPFKLYGDKVSFDNPVDLKAGDKYALTVTGVGGSSLIPLSTNAHYLGYVTLTAVPEPAEWAMLLSGLGLGAWVLRRKSFGSVELMAA